MSCINILRYISDHLEQLAFPVRYHMMNIKDVPILFVTLMEMKLISMLIIPLLVIILN